MTAEIIHLSHSTAKRVIVTAPRVFKGPSFRDFVEALSTLTPERLPEFIAGMRRSAGLPPMQDDLPSRTRKKRPPPSEESKLKRAETCKRIAAGRLPIKERLQLIAGQMKIPGGDLRRAMRADHFGLVCFCEWYPVVNIEWLITGQGSMYRTWEA